MRHEMALRRRLHTLHTLHDAVSAMRSLSAHHFRMLRKALPAARDYRTEIDSVVAEIGVHQPLHGLAPGGLVVVASDLGLCGDYNARLAQQTVAEHAHRQLGRRVFRGAAGATHDRASRHHAPLPLRGARKPRRTLPPVTAPGPGRVGGLCGHAHRQLVSGVGTFRWRRPFYAGVYPSAPHRLSACGRPGAALILHHSRSPGCGRGAGVPVHFVCTRCYWTRWRPNTVCASLPPKPPYSGSTRPRNTPHGN